MTIRTTYHWNVTHLPGDIDYSQV
uniref:Uncharacterized protein n=1 Tax=Lepeophtheirus salmonis TaxID=72036 RepID=A0A0K2U8U7_LEPSM